MFNTKKRFFKNKVKEVNKYIWDLEFKIEKSRQVREGIRLDRDKAVETVIQLETQLKNTTDSKLKESLEAQKKHNEENIPRYEAQMKMIDAEINGGQPTEENPAGIGIIERIKSFIELREMYKDYAKKL